MSPTSAERFARRVRARRRRRALIAVAVLLAVAGLAWGALKSPWATVQRIDVTGTDRVPAGTVRALAGTELGRPVLLARTSAIAALVGREPLVRSVTVERHWPGALRVRVVERVAVAALPSGRGVALVDVDGVVVERARSAPPSVPRLEVALGPRGVPAMRGCLAVLADLPPAIRQRLLAIGADSPDGIWLRLRESRVKGGARVDWGSSADTARKAEVLTAFLPKHHPRYDVRSPERPAFRER